MRAIAVLIGLSVALAPSAPAAAQALGTFAWPIEPYCNIVKFSVTPDGPAYRLRRGPQSQLLGLINRLAVCRD